MKPLNPAPGTGGLDPERLGSLFIGIAVGSTLLLIFMWWKFHVQIVIAILAIQGAELGLIGLFTHSLDALHNNLRNAVPERVSPKTLWTLCNITGSYLRWVAVPFMIGLAAICMVRAPRELYRQRFDLDGMQAALAKIHPIGAAWIGKEIKLAAPAEIDPSSPPGTWQARPMDPALRVSEWKERYMTGKTAPERRRNATSALKAQLGTPWAGVSSLSPTEQTLFVAFALYIARRKEEAQNILEAFSKALSGTLRDGAPTAPATLPAHFHRTLARQMKSVDLERAIDIASKHGWTRTALLSLLQQARLRSGVVNPGLFASVQLVDRALWLILAAASYPRDAHPAHVMTIAPCIEAAGAISVWVAECSDPAGNRNRAPSFETILTALDTP